ncbi:MAG: hypothetical protein D6693_06720 [Planctomycetota bacterium]|nr:MAG: hypothetical protein D6693_06720 [Planctomycetota bacterium]
MTTTRARPIHRLLAVICPVLVAVFGAAGAMGQGAFGDRPFGRPGGEGRPARPPGQEVVASVKTDRREVRPGDTLTVAVILDHAEHWHTWPSAAQDVLEPALAEFALRTDVGFSGDAPAWVGAVGPVQWPEPSLAPVANPAGGDPVQAMTYQGRAIAYLPVVVSSDASPGEAVLPVRVFYQACNDVMCLAPRTVTLEAPVTIVQAGAEIPPAPADGDFAGFDPSVYARMQEGVIVQPAGGAAGRRTFFGVPAPTGEGLVGVVVLALLGMLGGFILNLTPCVLPVIPIKVLTISQHAKTPGRALALGLWMSAGVVAFWTGIGLPMAFFSAATDPSRLFGLWWFTLGIGLLIGAMGVGILGVFQIKLPDKLYMVNPKADSPGGSFLFGVMTAVLGLPCFGFVAGALLAGAATLPPATVMVIFASLGVGMAAPYLVLSARPSLVDRLPKTGPASELVKQVMGLLMLAAAAFFVGAAFLAIVSERPALAQSLPWWAKVAHWWVVGGLVVAAAGWLLYRTVRITPRLGRRVVFGVVALALAALAVAWTAEVTRKAFHDFWQPFDEPALVAALESGDVVVLDFTAEWCLNCKALKAAVLDREPVRSALREAGVTPLVADLTSTQAPGWEKLTELGQTGIPLLVVYGPGLDEPWQSNAYTSEQVLSAIERARGATPTAEAR